MNGETFVRSSLQRDIDAQNQELADVVGWLAKSVQTEGGQYGVGGLTEVIRSRNVTEFSFLQHDEAVLLCKLASIGLSKVIDEYVKRTESG